MNSAPAALRGHPRGECGAKSGRASRAAGSWVCKVLQGLRLPVTRPPTSPMARSVSMSDTPGPGGRGQSPPCTCTEIAERMRGPRKAGGRAGRGPAGPRTPAPATGFSCRSEGVLRCAGRRGPQTPLRPRPRANDPSAPRGAGSPGRPLPRAPAGRRVQTMGREMEMLS